MYVKQDLVFENSTGALFGFTDLGEVNNQLDEFEASLKNNALLLQRPLAKTMIVLMFKDLFANTASPYYAQFASSSFTGADMFPFLWKVIERLTRTGYYILGLTYDGGSPTVPTVSIARESKGENYLQGLKSFYQSSRRNSIFYGPSSSA